MMASSPIDIDDIRDREFPQLRNCTYLDHAGTQLPPRSLIDSFAADMKTNLYGNPHSASKPSRDASQRVNETRLRALHFLGADPEEYDLIFVANATAAVKMVAESFRDYVWQAEKRHARTKRWSRAVFRVLLDSRRPRFRFLYHKDCHTSLVGIRELSSDQHCFQNDREVESWIATDKFTKQDVALFAYPGQSNMTGRRLPLQWPSRIRASTTSKNTYVLLDAAALATTRQMHISAWEPDFVALSFYKIFGFPDLGALVVRKATGSHIMNARRYFGGGTVEMVIIDEHQWHAKKDDVLHNAHEDGTLPFHSIIALSHALDSIQRVYGGMSQISSRTQWLTQELYMRLVALCHFNGKPVIKVYNDSESVYGNKDLQGATVAFSILRSDGSVVGFKEVENKADEHSIYIRSGALCNPGGVATYLGWSGNNLQQAYQLGHRCSSPEEHVFGKVTGVVRASLGASSSHGDILRLIDFIRDLYAEIQPGFIASSSVVRMNSEFGAPKSSSIGTTSRISVARMGGSDENIISSF